MPLRLPVGWSGNGGFMTGGSFALVHPGLRRRGLRRHARVCTRASAGANTSCWRVLVAVVQARGTIDADHVDALVSELERAVAAGVERLLVDLSEAEDVTTAGINLLLDTRQQLITRNGVIALVLPHRLRRRFELLHLDRRFLLASSRRRAADLLGITVAHDPATDTTSRYPRAA